MVESELKFYANLYYIMDYYKFNIITILYIILYETQEFLSLSV